MNYKFEIKYLYKEYCKALILVILVVCSFLATDAGAAVGCTLSNPAQDLKFLFPEMTTYKEEVRQFDLMKNGKELFSELKERLGSDLDPVYETFETPYTLYTIFNGEKIIGYVHGVNVPGEGGVIQIFMSVDPETGAILRMFFQRIESTVAKALKKKDFLAQFNGLTLADFYKHDYFAVVEPASTNDRIAQIKSPIPEGQASADYAAALRGVRKDLILIDIFVYNRKNEPFYRKAQDELAKRKGL
ncbi:MAG: hypothetical protein PHR77_09080 [Kiritimatiellae bacterium]|nr:hypothetical protein [Kiritimatiellia bacterium]MDD5519370.1 hypothetical protein [Kiritimatiellia bacterium]